MGPALILTGVVLACGLAVTVFSDLPSLRLFGRLSATTLVAAMVGGLLILPACMLLAKRGEAAIGGRLARRGGGRGGMFGRSAGDARTRVSGCARRMLGNDLGQQGGATEQRLSPRCGMI